MYRRATLLLGAALLGLAQAQRATLTPPPGPRPTAAPARIAKRDIEIHQDYGAPIGVDTNYLQQDGSTTKWIGVNTEYLTEETRTTTIDNVETTTVVKPQLAVVTATVASEGVEVGDVTVLISDSLQDQLNNIVKEAAASCAAPAKLRKRDGACMIRAMQGAAQDDGALSLVNPAEWEAFALELSERAHEIMRAAFQVLATQVQRNRFAIMIAAAGTAGAFAAEPVVEVAHKFLFGQGKFGAEKSGDNNNNDDEPSKTSKPESSSTSMCDPSGTVDENSPACDDEDCKGTDKVCQADGEYKNCPCANWVSAMYEGHFDKAWADAQQAILLELEAALPDVIPPQCFRNTYGDNFAGEPQAEPSAFCRCSSMAGNGMTEGNYATMTGEGDAACTYATMPTQTIEITMKPKETGPVTSCRWESSDGLEPYCTCNDDKMHGSIVTKYQGKETTVCPDATATMTELETPTAEALNCYPTHGSGEVEEFFKFCNFNRDQLYDACRQEINGDGGISLQCNQPIKDIWNPLPHYYNDFKITFERADNAPDDCKYVFSQYMDMSLDDPYHKDVPLRVDAFCIPVLQEIVNKCTWNGGEAKNPCGTFKFQSCVKDKGCKWGDPGFNG